MRLIGVVDLAGGRAVHARGGIRARYVPVQTIGGSAIDGNPLALARAYVDQFGLTELYVADLDAILGGEMQDTPVRDLATIAPLWVDGGVSSAENAVHVRSLGATRVVIGLETLGSFDALPAICAAVGGEHVAFSLDLREGEPVAAASLGIPPNGSAHLLAARAADAGVAAVIVIDLARVGTATGLDFDLIARVRAAAPGPILLAGGGVRGLGDLARLADVGCDGALVASALHGRAIGAADIAAVQRLGSHRSATR
jgi:phosphoribosylformimino-5-aminoimidazole carboxamide ribotide isomerase